jgi:hypothetical protein
MSVSMPRCGRAKPLLETAGVMQSPFFEKDCALVVTLSQQMLIVRLVSQSVEFNSITGLTVNRTHFCYRYLYTVLCGVDYS